MPSQAFNALAGEVRRLKGAQVPTGGDGSIRATLVNINAGVLELAKKHGHVAAGVGQIDKALRRVMGNKAARRFAHYGVAFNVVRHIHEVDIEAAEQDEVCGDYPGRAVRSDTH